MQDAAAAPIVCDAKISRIRPFKGQPRKHFEEDSMQALAGSIEAEGQKTLAEVRPVRDDPDYDYELVDGERRYRACVIAGLDTLRVVVQEYAGEDEQFVSSVMANFGREGHTPLETARAVDRLLKMPRYSDGTRTDRIARVAKIFAKSPAWIYQHLNLLELHPDVQAMLEPGVPEERRLGLSIAAFLYTHVRDKELQLQIANAISARGLKLNQARRLALNMAEAAGGLIEDGRRRHKPSDAQRTFLRFLDRLSEGTTAVLELPQKGFAEALRKQTSVERRALAKRLQKGIDALAELKEIVERPV